MCPNFHSLKLYINQLIWPEIVLHWGYLLLLTEECDTIKYKFNFYAT